MVTLTRAEVAKPVDVVLIYRPTAKTCMRKNGRERKLKYLVNHIPKTSRAKGSTVDRT